MVLPLNAEGWWGMKRLLAMTAVVAGTLVATSVPAYAGILTATSNEHPIGGSGVSGTIHFVDDGSTLTVTGTASGLTAGVVYFSLIYTDGTTSGGIAEGQTMPSTSRATPACSGVNHFGNNLINANKMVLGLWTPLGSPNATLNVVKSSTGNSQDALFIGLGLKSAFEGFGYVFGASSYVPIGDTWNTASIRNVNANFALVACGQVH